MRPTSKKLKILPLLLAICVAAGAAQVPENTNKNENSQVAARKIQNLKLRFNEFAGPLQGSMWTLTHDYSEKTKVKEILDALVDAIELLDDQEKPDTLKVQEIERHKEKFVSYLNSEDEATQSFAAIVIGMFGDPKHIPSLLEVLKEPYSKDELKDPRSDTLTRGNAAIGLAMIGNEETKKDIAALFESKNPYDRSKAVMALTMMDAKEYAPAVVKLAIRLESSIHGSESAVYFLVETRTANNHRDELARIMLNSIDNDTAEAAAYALVSINATGKAKDMAQLLDRDLSRNFAAKALALLGARSYADRIGMLLVEELGKPKPKIDKGLGSFAEHERDSFFVQAASLALGLLNATKYSPALLTLLEDENEFVRSDAAVGLILMDDTEIRERAVRVVKASGLKVDLMAADDFHSIVADKVKEISAKLKERIR